MGRGGVIPALGRVVVLALALAGLLPALALAADPPPEDSYRNGVYLEAAAGDLEAAAVAYVRAGRTAGAAPGLAAESLLRAAACLERLGRAGEALALCREVAAKVPPAPAPALAEARRRIGILEPAASPSAADAPGRTTPTGAAAAGASASKPDALLDTLASGDPAERYGAIRALRQMRPSEVVPAVIQRLDHESPKVRHYAVILLGHLRDRAAVPALRRRLDEDPVPEIRANAALALLKLDDRTGAGALRDLLENGNDHLRSLAAAYLAHFGDKAGAAVLVADLASEDAYRREAAIGALVRLYGDALGYDPHAPEPDRAAALEAWRAKVAEPAPSEPR